MEAVRAASVRGQTKRKEAIAESHSSIIIMARWGTRQCRVHYIPFLTVALHDKDYYSNLTEWENEKQRI